MIPGTAMLRVIDMLKASADRKTAMEPQPPAAASRKVAGPRSDDIAIEAQRSRSPVAMKRATVRANLTPDTLSGASDRTARALRADAELDTAIDKLFDHQDGFWKADFARILQVALCDLRLTECLCHLHDRLRSDREGCHA